MLKIASILKNEEGSLIVMTIMLLVLLTIVGLAGTSPFWQKHGFRNNFGRDREGILP